MDQAALASDRKAPARARSEGASRSWRLIPEHAREAQGLVVSPFGHLPVAQAMFLHADRTGGGWLRALREAAPVTAADGKDQHASTAIALTWSGLKALGLDEDALASFSQPFQQGMHQEDRRRRLGDVSGQTVVADGPRWSGNAEAAKHEGAAPPTPVTVHALLLLYARDDAALQRRAADAATALRGEGVEVVHELPLSLRFDADGRAREHFGFADGFSQPIPHGPAIVPPAGVPESRYRWHGIAAGDILVGHRNAHDEDAPGPVVAGSADPQGLLPKGAAPEGFVDLGRNGTYLVVRELRQDVAAFWTSLDAAAAARGEPGVDADWLAARIIGRERDGDLLIPGGTLPAKDGEPDNDFGFLDDDPHGYGCPFGSHVRRANPRDGLAAEESDGPTLLAAANNHRILRRARKFGPAIADLRDKEDKAHRGLLFMCLNTDIARQFEFIQQTWLFNRGFATLHGETDPLMGPKGFFTLPAEPVRRRVEVETYVQMVGGEYFFLPSLPALDYLASLTGEPTP